MMYAVNECLNIICGMLLPALLLACGVFFFIRLAVFVFSPRFVKNGLKNAGGLSSLWLALGGTLGVGNICGVAAAIYTGGAGCVFWIWVCSVLSAATKYAETVLSVHFRQKTTFECFGGTHLYIEKGLGAKRLASVFCILCIITAFTMGNITQVKVAADFAGSAIGIPRVACAFVFFISIFFISSGKGNRIKSFTSKAVPVLCVIYTLLCIAVVFKNCERIPSVTKQILKEAFTPRAGFGGLIGILCSPSLRLGITRGVMSNEAGCGTAPMAYASNPDASPVGSGLLGIIEVFTDTLLLCSLTAYAILLSGVAPSASSADTVINAFSFSIGGFSSLILALSVYFFALAATSAWAFYAQEAMRYLKARKCFYHLFYIAYPTASFIGCFIVESVMWRLADLCVACISIINVTAILLLQSEVKEVTLYEYKNLSLRVTSKDG